MDFLSSALWVVAVRVLIAYFHFHFFSLLLFFRAFGVINFC